MAVTIKSTVIALVLFGGALGLYRYTQALDDDDGLTDKAAKIYEADNFFATKYDAAGNKESSIKAVHVTFNEATDIADFKLPILHSYKKNKQGEAEIWKLTGDIGQLHNNDYAKLNGHVVLVPEFQGAAISKATTANGYYDLKNNEITSKDKTTIYGQGWINSGTDFKIDLNTNVMTYKGNVNATYYPSNGSGN